MLVASVLQRPRSARRPVLGHGAAAVCNALETFGRKWFLLGSISKWFLRGTISLGRRALLDELAVGAQVGAPVLYKTPAL